MTFQTKSSDSVGSAGASIVQNQSADPKRTARFSTTERRAWRNRRKLRAMRSVDLRSA